MTCANHPDMAAMGTCAACARPLCSLCAFFRDGALVCADHAGEPRIAQAPDDAKAPALTGSVLPVPPAPGLGPGPASTRHWADDPRLDPLPMALRPGWTEEPLQPRPGITAETLGLIGLVAGLVTLPFSFCCGFGAIVGVPLALAAAAVSIAALVRASRARSPATARWTGGFGLGLSLLSLGLSVCLFAFTFGGLGQSFFHIGTP